MRYKTVKKYGHDLGFSVAFRQWKANSHCSKIHGYALAFRFVFVSDELDHRNWVVDFGDMKSLKEELSNIFDHTTIIAQDDPELPWFIEAEKRGLLKLVIVKACGCEKFAELAYNVAYSWLVLNGYINRVYIESVEVSEHGANSAIYSPWE